MSPRPRLFLAWIAAIATFTLFTVLGFWQLERRTQKQTMLDATARVLQLRKVEPWLVAADPERTATYDWVAAQGAFIDAPAVLLDNQQRDGRVGVRVYQVFVPNHDVPVLVELGWLPVTGDRRMPVVPKPEGEQRIAGLLMPPPARGIGGAVVVGLPDGSKLTTGLDIDVLRDALGQPNLAPRVLKLDPALPLGYQRDLDILPNTMPPERHLGYAVQWFALAVAVAILALILSLRRRGKSSKAPQ